MQTNVTHITPLTFIRRARLLPMPGRVLAHEGQKIAAGDVVAEGWTMGQHVLIDVRRALGLTRSDQAEKLIEKNEGERVNAGEILAQSRGLMARFVRAPLAGQIVAISNGRILLEAPGQAVRLTAGFAGVVAELVPERGVVVETHGALVQGVWGNDRFDQGVLLSVTHSPLEELTEKNLDVSMRGAVVLAGTCASRAALKMADELPLRGLILSSLAPELVPQAAKLSLPVVVVEGFGKLPYNSVAYKILSTSEKRDACLKASSFNAYTGERPEIILPLPAIGETAPDTVEFQAGLTVRILDVNAPSRMGTILQVRPGAVRLANGLTTRAADVRLESNEVVSVPLANLDVLD
jgi:hypothetical protein